MVRRRWDFRATQVAELPRVAVLHPRDSSRASRAAASYIPSPSTKTENARPAAAEARLGSRAPESCPAWRYTGPTSSGAATASTCVLATRSSTAQDSSGWWASSIDPGLTSTSV